MLGIFVRCCGPARGRRQPPGCSSRCTRPGATRSRGSGSPCCTSASRTSECAPASEEDVLRCHTPALVERVRSFRGWLDGDTVCTETSFDAALLAAGARDRGGAARRLRARAAARATTRGRARRWASASSTRSRSPRAGRRPSSASGASRSSTGTCTTATGRRTIVGDDPSILFVSLHQWPFYPGTGGPGEQGETLLNIPLARGHGRRRRTSPRSSGPRHAIAAFEPELLLVSAGFDAHVDDPLAGLELCDGAFARARPPRARARPARRRRARGRLQPRDAAGPRRGRSRGFAAA